MVRAEIGFYSRRSHVVNEDCQSATRDTCGGFSCDVSLLQRLVSKWFEWRGVVLSFDIGIV